MNVRASLALAFVSALGVALVGAGCNTTTVFEDDDGEGGVCSAYQDEQSEGAVTIRFKNESGLDVYLDAACDRLLYGVDAVPDDGVSYRYSLDCAQTCEEAQEREQFDCAGACQSLAYRVPAGGTLEVTWGGTGLQNEDMPAACFVDQENAPQSCSRIVAAQPGTYAVSVKGYANCQGQVGPGSACECDADGKCYGGLATGPEAEIAGVQFEYPTPAVVEVTFPVCAFGCAGG
jgi:hypothetical protein